MAEHDDEKTPQKLEFALPEVFTAHQRERILVIKLGAFGDLVQSFGLIRAIHEAYPKHNITLMTSRGLGELARGCPYIQYIYLDDRPNLWNLASWIQLARWLREQNFKYIFDLQNNDRSRIYRSISSKNADTQCFYLQKDKKKMYDGHAFNRDQGVLGKAGINKTTYDPMAWKAAHIDHFSLKSPYVLLVPGCAPHRPEKRWPAEFYARLAQLLHASGYQPIIIGTDAESHAAEIILKKCPSALNLIGQTSFSELAEIGRGAAYAFGNDTGPMHLLGVIGCPLLVLYGQASDPAKHRPLGKFVKTLQSKDLQTLSVQKVFKYFAPRHQARGEDVKVFH